MSKMTLKVEGDTHVVVTRHFAAPPEAIYRAHTDPALVQKWMLGPPGWTMPVCQLDPRPGGVSPSANVPAALRMDDRLRPSGDFWCGISRSAPFQCREAD